MKDYVLKDQPAPASNDIVRVLDFSEGSIGKNKTGEDCPRRFYFKKRFLTRRVRMANSEPVNSGVGLRYLTLS